MYVIAYAHDRRGPMSSPYITVETVAERYDCSIRSIHELTRSKRIPHRRLPGTRRCLFVLAELDAYDAGAELEVQEMGAGGRIVTPKDT